jgi:Sulfatase
VSVDTAAAVEVRGAQRVSRVDLALSALAVTAIAVAQPILDLLGRTPEFFTARAAPTADVVLLGVALGLGIPLLIAGIVILADVISHRAGVIVHAAVLVTTGALLTLQVLRRTGLSEWPGWIQVAIAVVAGAALAIGYHRWRPARRLLNYAAIAPVVVLVVFAVIAPTSALIWGDPASAAEPVALPANPTAPVIMIVFDEFPVATLLDEQGGIRAEDFPGFAKLAADGTWFRNAVGSHERTEEALPTILSGWLAPLDEKVPTAAEYPETLFTLLGGSYRVSAWESVTELCPPTVCVGGSRQRLSASSRWRSLGSDLSVVAGHVFLPTQIAASLPPIDQSWAGFAVPETQEDWNLNRRFIDHVDADRRLVAEQFLDDVDHPLAPDELHFAHLLLPHTPWDLLPDGKRYIPDLLPPGEATTWSSDAWLVEQAYQRHLLQVMYVDTLIGELIDRLERNDSYDEALIVVTADHGTAVRPKTYRRIITPDNVGEVAAVPLFVKRPGAKGGAPMDDRAESVDVLPTMAAVLGVEVPWEVDGVNLFGDMPPRTESTMIGSDQPVTFGVDGTEKLDVARYHLEWFGDRGPYGLVPSGYADLFGANLDGLTITESPNAGVRLDQRYPVANPDEDDFPSLMSGVITGVPPANQFVAVAFDGTVEAVTRTWYQEDEVHFQAMVPPKLIEGGGNPEIYLVTGREGERRLTHLPR